MERGSPPTRSRHGPRILGEPKNRVTNNSPLVQVCKSDDTLILVHSDKRRLLQEIQHLQGIKKVTMLKSRGLHTRVTTQREHRSYRKVRTKCRERGMWVCSTNLVHLLSLPNVVADYIQLHRATGRERNMKANGQSSITQEWTEKQKGRQLQQIGTTQALIRRASTRERIGRENKDSTRKKCTGKASRI